jgi:transposase
MNRAPKANYTKEFREEAVKLVLGDGLSQLEAARRLSLSNKTLGNWVRAAQKGELTGIGKQQKPVTELEAELERVKRELAVVTMERDVLKKRRSISRRSRGEIRPDRSDATGLSGHAVVRGLRGRGKRLLRLAQTANVAASTGECPA